MKLAKDLLYERTNTHLDISRLASVLGVLVYLGATIFHVAKGGEFDFVAWGGGWTALCAGCAGWIYARQKWEVETIRANNPAPAPAQEMTFPGASNWGTGTHNFGGSPPV